MAHPSLLASTMCSVGLRRVLATSYSIIAARTGIIHRASWSSFRLHEPQSDHTPCKSFFLPRASGYRCLASGCNVLSNRELCCNWNSLRLSCGKLRRLSNLAEDKCSKLSSGEIASSQSRHGGGKLKRTSEILSCSADASYTYTCCRLQGRYSSEQARSKNSVEAGKLLSDNVVGGPETFRQQILHTISKLVGGRI